MVKKVFFLKRLGGSAAGEKGFLLSRGQGVQPWEK